jgi:hypothetical protein
MVKDIVLTKIHGCPVRVPVTGQGGKKTGLDPEKTPECVRADYRSQRIFGLSNLDRIQSKPINSWQQMPDAPRSGHRVSKSCAINFSSRQHSCRACSQLRRATWRLSTTSWTCPGTSTLPSISSSPGARRGVGRGVCLWWRNRPQSLTGETRTSTLTKMLHHPPTN